MSFFRVLRVVPVNELKDLIMSSLEAIKQTTQNEAAEVKAHVDAVAIRVKELEDQLAAGQEITPEQLEEVRQGIENIFTTPSNPDPNA